MRGRQSAVGQIVDGFLTVKTSMWSSYNLPITPTRSSRPADAGATRAPATLIASPLYTVAASHGREVTMGKIIFSRLMATAVSCALTGMFTQVRAADQGITG